VEGYYDSVRNLQIGETVLGFTITYRNTHFRSSKLLDDYGSNTQNLSIPGSFNLIYTPFFDDDQFDGAFGIILQSLAAVRGLQNL